MVMAKRKVILGLVVLFIFSLGALYADGPRSIYIVIPGATRGLDPTSLLKDPAVKQVIQEIEIFSPNGSAFPFKHSQPDPESPFDLYKGEETVFKITIHYPKELQDIEPVKEIAQESYSDEARGFMSAAAATAVDIVSGFRNRNSQGTIQIIGVGMSGEAVIEAVGRNAALFDKITLMFPTMAMVKEGRLLGVLKDRGYTKERVAVIAYEGDPTIPFLEKLNSGENNEIFLFAKIQQAQ